MPAPIVNDSVVSGIRKFLEALNSSGGTPIEQLSPKDARQVLIDAQNSVAVDLSGIERAEKTIDHDGKPKPHQLDDTVCRFRSPSPKGRGSSSLFGRQAL